MVTSKPSTVLVVEDHPMSRKMLMAMLGQSYSVIPAASGLEAVALSREQKPDLVLLDIEMPGMDGFQTLDILKKEVIDQAVPVIFLTAREDSDSKEKGLEAGAVDYITKPYDRHELSIKVKNHLALYQARKEIEEKNRIMAREMVMASQLQNSLLPQRFPQNDKLDFAVAYKPVSTAGGDFYDVIELPGGAMGFAQVDVSGHGVASAMIGAMFKMAFQSFGRSTESPARLLELLNTQMFELLPESDFLTVFYGIIDPVSFSLIYTNAGHPRPFLYRKLSGCVEDLCIGGPLVGAFADMDFQQESLQLCSGDRLLVFTDGVTETQPEAESDCFYGEPRLREIFLNTLDLPCAEVLSRILDDLERFRGGPAFEDDVTLLMVSVR